MKNTNKRKKEFKILEKDKIYGCFLQLKYGRHLLKEIEVSGDREPSLNYLNSLKEGFEASGWEPQSLSEAFEDRVARLKESNLVTQ